jgi:uncharacterized membrane protein YecN with MAPEG domain
MTIFLIILIIAACCGCSAPWWVWVFAIIFTLDEWLFR